MNVSEINAALLQGEIEEQGIFPHLDSLKDGQIVFDFNFGLDILPREPGIIVVRGARQYGKSTWLEKQIRDTIREFGAGSALYLNGDEIKNAEEFFQEIRTIINLFSPEKTIKRIFIDEITAVDGWVKPIKRLADSGELREILLVTTGSKAADLRHGTERLPGRKGKLERTIWYFTPISYAEFSKYAQEKLGEKTLDGYLLSGGCPVAAAEIINSGKVPEYVLEMVKDWIYGECAISGRNRSSLLAVFEMLFRFGGTPVGQAKLAREAGLANNTIASGYIELLMDLMCISTCFPIDIERNVPIRRKPAKFHCTNLLAALSWDSDHKVSLDSFQSMPSQKMGMWYEWAVAQEIWRRAVISGADFPEYMTFWQSKEHEVDFVLENGSFIEVKYGAASPLDFVWFPKVFHNKELVVINTKRFQSGFCKGITLEDFLLEKY
jgi:predicted AAA+ superfamily ATPase